MKVAVAAVALHSHKCLALQQRHQVAGCRLLSAALRALQNVKVSRSSKLLGQHVRQIAELSKNTTKAIASMWSINGFLRVGTIASISTTDCVY